MSATSATHSALRLAGAVARSRRGVAAAVLAVVLGATGCRMAARQPGPAPAAGALTLATVRAYTPLLAESGYRRLSGSPWRGVWIYGRPGVPGLQLLVDGSNDVVGVRGVFPRGVGLQPWYDQALSATAGASGAGGPGTPAGAMQKNQASGSASPATAASSSASPATAASSSASPAPPASSSSASGASVSPAPATGAPGTPAATPAGTVPSANTAGGSTGAISGAYTQTVWLVNPAQAGNPGAASLLGSWRQLAAANPTLRQARQVTPFIAGMGRHYGHQGYGLLVMADRSGRVTGVEGYFPGAQGWQPMYDQLPLHVDTVPALHLEGYSQHVFFVAPTSIR